MEFICFDQIPSFVVVPFVMVLHVTNGGGVATGEDLGEEVVRSFHVGF